MSETRSISFVCTSCERRTKTCNNQHDKTKEARKKTLSQRSDYVQVESSAGLYRLKLIFHIMESGSLQPEQVTSQPHTHTPVLTHTHTHTFGHNTLTFLNRSGESGVVINSGRCRTNVNNIIYSSSLVKQQSRHTERRAAQPRAMITTGSDAFMVAVYCTVELQSIHQGAAPGDRCASRGQLQQLSRCGESAIRQTGRRHRYSLHSVFTFRTMAHVEAQQWTLVDHPQRCELRLSCRVFNATIILYLWSFAGRL